MTLPWGFLSTDSTSVLVTGLFLFSISSRSSEEVVNENKRLLIEKEQWRQDTLDWIKFNQYYRKKKIILPKFRIRSKIMREKIRDKKNRSGGCNIQIIEIRVKNWTEKTNK